MLKQIWPVIFIVPLIEDLTTADAGTGRYVSR
jgi:hypothetical protein